MTLQWLGFYMSYKAMCSLYILLYGLRNLVSNKEMNETRYKTILSEKVSGI